MKNFNKPYAQRIIVGEALIVTEKDGNLVVTVGKHPKRALRDGGCQTTGTIVIPGGDSNESTIRMGCHSETCSNCSLVEEQDGDSTTYYCDCDGIA